MTNDLTSSPAPSTVAGGSLLDSLRARNAQVREATTVRILISGYRTPRLFGVYRLVSDDESKAIGEKLTEQFETDLEKLHAGSLDLLIAALVRFDAAEDLTGPFEPLTDAGTPITHWDQLASALVDGYQPARVREAVVAVFPGKTTGADGVDRPGNPFAASRHAQQLQEWMADTSIGVDKEFLGEA